jgi:hypothetical protein
MSRCYSSIGMGRLIALRSSARYNLQGVSTPPRSIRQAGRQGLSMRRGDYRAGKLDQIMVIAVEATC